ncbi:MAG: ABC transporter permease [Culicoidibacterales bacterium]
MRFRDLVEIIWRNMWKRRTRTLFTMSGVVIGCLSIFLIISVTNGFENYLTTSMQEMMDTSVIQVYPNYQSNDSGEDRSTLSAKDVTLLEELGYFASVTPKQYAHTMIKWQKAETYLGILAFDDYANFDTNQLQAGRLPNAGSRELVIGYEVAKTLLGYEWGEKISDPTEVTSLVGQKVKIGTDSTSEDDKGNKFAMKKFSTTIVGVLSPKAAEYSYDALGSGKFVQTILKSEIEFYQAMSPDQPADTSKLKNFSSIAAKVVDVNQLSEAEAAIKNLGYQTSSAKEFEQQTKMLLLGVNIVLGALAGISLLVSALGITNTMDMAIYERNKEIGIIKVIGGSVNDVIKIFVGEACAISLSGGVLAIIIGGVLTLGLNAVGSAVTADLLGQAIEQIAIPTFGLVGGILIFCFVIGFLAGIVPARKAAKTDIITAIK